jgi:FixJ family two-component response regulator
VAEDKETVTIWARVTKRERQVIEEIAKGEDRSLAYVATRLLRESLEHRARQNDQTAAPLAH